MTALLMGSLTFTVIGQNAQRPGQTTPPPALPSAIRSGPVTGTPQTPQADQAARTFITQGQGYLAEGRLSEAKEALRTAIKLEPMNLEAWSWYDYVVETSYVKRARDDKQNPVIERDLKPTFSIDNVDSYREYNTMYIVGEVKNTSDSLKSRIELTGTLLDDQNEILRKSTVGLTLKSRGLFPSEVSLFEIPFPDPPPGVKSMRVRVTHFE